jgi:hypothetical protein
MPMKSQAQRGAMYAAKAGKSTLGIPQSVGAEFVKSDEGGKLPRKVKKNTRNYAKGGSVQAEDLTQGDATLSMARGLPVSTGGLKSAFVDPNKYPGWPQMAGIDGPRVKGGGGDEE